MDSTLVPLHCRICNKTLNGPKPARQHYESAEHKRKEVLAQKANSIGVPFCTVCNIQCDTLKQLELHQKSPRHLANAEKKTALESQLNPLAQGLDGSQESPRNQDYVFDGNKGYCYLCKIELTSHSHAKSHINGKNHQKKKQIGITNSVHAVGNSSSQSPKYNISSQSCSGQSTHHPGIGNMTTEPITASTSLCDVSDFTINGPECGAQHLYSSQRSVNHFPVAVGGHDTCSFPIKETNSHCSVCNVPFSCPENARQHYSSAKHKKKVEQAYQEKPEYYCDLCKVSFTGPESQQTHNISEKHRKKVKLEEMKKRGEEIPVSCNACGTRFTGPESAEDHFKSKKHKANLENMQLKKPCSGKFINIENFTENAYSKQEICNKSIHITNDDGNDDELIAKPIAAADEKNSLMGNSKLFVKLPSDNRSINNAFSRSETPTSESCSSAGMPDPDADHVSIVEDSTAYPINSCQQQQSSYCNDIQEISDTTQVTFVKNDLSINRGKGRGFLSLDLASCHLKLGKFTSLVQSSSGQYDSDKVERESNEEAKMKLDLDRKEHNPGRFQEFYEKDKVSTDNDTAGNCEAKITPDVNVPHINTSSAEQMTANGMTAIRSYSNDSNSSDAAYTFDPVAERGRCNVCNIELTSRNHMVQHTTGKNHLRACEVLKQISIAGLDNPMICQICHVTFTGLESKKQHLESAKHQVKAAQIQRDSNEFYCHTCMVACSGHVSYQQHLAGAQHRKAAGIQSAAEPLVSFDKTAWYQCKVCNCHLNSLEQLQIHEKSPKHLAKLQKTNPCMTMQEYATEPMFGTKVAPAVDVGLYAPHQPLLNNNPLIHSSNEVLIKPRHDPLSSPSSGMLSPLQSFLSEELFPPEFLPEEVKVTTTAKPAERVEPEVTSGPLPSHLPLYTHLDRNESRDNDERGDDGAGNGHASSASRTTGSDLAFATKNRGCRDNKAPSDKPPHTNTAVMSPATYNRMRADGTLAQGTNPYADTHAFYCHTCKSPMNTRESYEAHLKGKRHLARVSTEPAPVRRHLAPTDMDPHYIPFSKNTPRKYQLELYRKAMARDTLCFLPTGTGKTLVSVLAVSAMLEKCPTKNVLFLVDKVLLVLQQSKYIQEELQGNNFNRPSYLNEDCTEMAHRPINVAGVCMGQQNTQGIPIWKLDVIVVTAAFCQNLLDRKILRWEDFSLVVFDEAHHCEKAHPFNTLLQNYHNPITVAEDRPKVLGLTASPAGKSDVNKTLQMLQTLVANMGGVRMGIVEEPSNVDELLSFQSNASLIIRPHKVGEEEGLMQMLKNEFYIYIVHCVLKLLSNSNIKHYLDNLDKIQTNMSEAEIRQYAEGFVEKNLDVLQSSLSMIENSGKLGKVEFSLLTCHLRDICMALNSLDEGGPASALEEIIEMEKTDQNFTFACNLGLPCKALHECLFNNLNGDSSENAPPDLHERRLVEELTDMRDLDMTSCKGQGHRPISLVLVKTRSTAHRITKLLQDHERLRALDLHTTMVVGHGSSQSEDKGMSVPQQKRVLEDIKQFKYQIIVATSVAEEGVDWPECQRVVSLYPPSTVTALVQMRGRARKKNSKFIVLCSNPEEEDKIRDILKREENMKIAASMLACQSR